MQAQAEEAATKARTLCDSVFLYGATQAEKSSRPVLIFVLP
jgi:hypothetical protein